MQRDQRESTTSRGILLATLCCLVLAEPGCSKQEERKPPTSEQISEARKIRFANDWVLVTVRAGLKAQSVPEANPAFVPKVGDPVVISDVGDGEVFMAGDLDSLKFYHSNPGPDQLARFKQLAEQGKLFVVARGTTGVVNRVVEGELADKLKAVELRINGLPNVPAWVSEPFVRSTVTPPAPAK